MDIYTASHRVSQRFQCADEPAPIGRHGVIGDGLTCALIGVDGAVDWLCLPRFDSPSVFASILDPERGGTFRIAPAARTYESLQGYDTDTNVLQTLFRPSSESAVVLTDFMPWTDDPRSSVHEVHRLLEARQGSAEMEVVFDPRFDYGRGETRIDLAEHGALAVGPHGERLGVSIGGGVRFEPRPKGGVAARFTLRTGQRLWTILSWRAVRPEPTAAHRPFEHMRSTRQFWRAWASRLQYDGPWRHDVHRSALVLKLLQYAPTGSMVAAATTSLPVSPDGARNWDYRFSWTRDSAMAIRAMNLIGYRDEARRFFHFVHDTVDRRGSLDLMVTIDGEDVPEEQVLEHLSGHGGSGTVRIGNQARHQSQIDIVGALLDAAFLYERSGGTLAFRLWRHVREIVDAWIERSGEPDHGMWEPRSAPGHHVHSKLMTWVALDRALRLAPLFGGDAAEPRWLRARDALRSEILERGVDPRSGTFVRVYGGSEVDATLLLFPLYGFLPASDPRVSNTLKRVIEELSDGRYLRRYRASDGIETGEGAFVLCGFWLAEALALAGRLDEALEVFHNHLSATNHVGLLAEEVDPGTGAPLGNFPQAFSHLGLIQAAARLDLALRLRDEGADRPPHLALDLLNHD